MFVAFRGNYQQLPLLLSTLPCLTFPFSFSFREQGQDGQGIEENGGGEKRRITKGWKGNGKEKERMRDSEEDNEGK